MRRATLFVFGSMRTTWPSVKSDVQTEPEAEISIPDPAPTLTVATRSKSGEAGGVRPPDRGERCSLTSARL